MDFPAIPISVAKKKSDKELLALLEGKQLAKDEIKQIRLAQEQPTREQQKNSMNQMRKEMSKLFNCTTLITNTLKSNGSISSKKLVELNLSSSNQKKSFNSTTSSDSDSMDYSSKVRETYEKNKDNYNLSKMNSHRDVLKQIKQLDKTKSSKSSNNKKSTKTDKTNDSIPEKPVDDDSDENSNDTNLEPTEPPPPPPQPALNNPVEKNDSASDFLKKRILEIQNIKKLEEQQKLEQANAKKIIEKDLKKNNADDFELELYVGDSITTKKLLDIDNTKSLKLNSFLTNKNISNTSNKRKFSETTTSTTAKPATTDIANKLDKKETKKMNKNLSNDEDSMEERKSKKRKLIDEILQIKPKNMNEIVEESNENSKLKSSDSDKKKEQKDSDDISESKKDKTKALMDAIQECSNEEEEGE